MNMSRVNEFIKKELSGWEVYEINMLVLIFAVIVFNAFILHDSKIAIISAVCGILYTVIAGKGKITCYLFGLTGSGFYSYLALKNCLYGNLLLYLCYYIPMQIIGILQWKKHLKQSTQEIYKTVLPKRERIILSLLAVVLSLAGCYLLYISGDKHPVTDGISTVLSLFGMYLTVRRCIEQWVVWAVVNALCVVMWVLVSMSGERVYSTVLMWTVYLFLSGYFYMMWDRELKLNQ